MSVLSLSYLGSQHDHDAIYPQLGRLQISIDGTGSADGARAAALLRGRRTEKGLLLTGQTDGHPIITQTLHFGKTLKNTLNIVSDSSN